MVPFMNVNFSFVRGLLTYLRSKVIFVACTVYLLTTVAGAHAEDDFSWSLLGKDTRGVISDLKGESIRVATDTHAATGLDPYWGGAAAAALGLAYLADTTVSSELRTNNTTADSLRDIGSFFGSPYLHLGVASGMYLSGGLAGNTGLKEYGVVLGEALVLADLSGAAIKQVVGRGRPNSTEHKDSVKPFAFERDYDSFPSLHTASSFAMASVVAQRTESVYISSSVYALAGLVGIARISQGAHWLSDVVAGAMLGELSGRIAVRYHASRTGTTSSTVTIMPTALNNGAGMVVMVRF